MMEKYGVSYEDVAPTDEQLRELKKLCLAKGIEYKMPKTANEALKQIEKLS